MVDRILAIGLCLLGVALTHTITRLPVPAYPLLVWPERASSGENSRTKLQNVMEDSTPGGADLDRCVSGGVAVGLHGYGLVDRDMRRLGPAVVGAVATQQQPSQQGCEVTDHRWPTRPFERLTYDKHP